MIKILIWHTFRKRERYLAIRPSQICPLTYMLSLWSIVQTSQSLHLGVETQPCEFGDTLLKPLYHFCTEQKLEVHRFTNKLQGLQKVMVKDFPWNIIPRNALLFEKTLKQLPILNIEHNGFILNTFHDTAKRADTRVGFPVIFSRLRWPIEPKSSQVCYFIYKL